MNYSPQTLAGRAVLLEIGARLGLLEPLMSRHEISGEQASRDTGVPKEMACDYYTALARAGLLRLSSGRTENGRHYVPADDFGESINAAGYALWGLISCAPLICHATAFSQNLTDAAARFPRDGEHVARTSKWMGERDFYPHAEETILSLSPKKIVDLGAGTCGLLMRCLKQLPDAVGVGIDMNADACNRGRDLIAAARLSDRLSVVHAPIQSLVEKPDVLEGADVLHAGFVFHDLIPEEEETLRALLRAFHRKSPRGVLIIVDAIPYAPAQDECAFSAAFTFLHSHFMGHKLLSETEWREQLRRAGFAIENVRPLGISGGRVFTARAA